MKRTAIHLIAIAVLGVLVYANTLDGPFQWDDKYCIKENQAIRDLRFFRDPESVKYAWGFYPGFKGRYVTFLTFALNYRFGGLDPKGYHAFNITLHILNAILLYTFVLIAFRTPLLSGSSAAPHKGKVALFTALLFVSHPLETQAVTYIYQRLASLAAFFCLLSITSYAASRVSEKRMSKYALYGLSIASAALAMKSKENAFTLPILITVFEIMFMEGPFKKRAALLLPLLLTMVIVPLGKIDSGSPLWEALSEATRSRSSLSRAYYLMTQFGVVATYLRLMLLPVNQNLDYDYPLYRSLFSPSALLPFLLLMALLCLGVYLSRRSSVPLGRIAGFGIFWFFITLLVESSAIPITDVIFEHRAYLPSAGAFMSFVCGALLLTRGRRPGALTAAMLVLVAVFSIAAHERNKVWESETALWEDVIKKSPNKARGYTNMGNVLRSMGRVEDAIRYQLKAVALDPRYVDGHYNLGILYASKGMADDAIREFRTAIRLDPAFANAHHNLGMQYLKKGMLKEAAAQFEAALRLDPSNREAARFLGYVSKNGVAP